jgi:hypothetical protein
MTTTEPNIENAAPVDPNAITMSINGKPVAARKGELIIAAADRVWLKLKVLVGQ